MNYFLRKLTFITLIIIAFNCNAKSISNPKQIGTILHPQYNFAIYNYTGNNVYWSYFAGFAVTVNGYKPPFPNTLPQNIKTIQIPVTLNESSVYTNLPKLISTGFYWNDNRYSYYVPGAIGINLSSNIDMTNNYSFYLARLGEAAQAFSPSLYKYAYVTNVLENNEFSVYLAYYDPTHIGAHTEDYLTNDLNYISANPNGGYIQNLGGNSPDIKVYICKKGQTTPFPCGKEPN